MSSKSMAKKVDNLKAQLYLDHLLNDGYNEDDSGYELELPPYYNEELFRK